MKVSFEFTTENENRNDLLLVAEFCNALAGNAKQPVLSAAVEPEDEERPVKTVAEIIAEERAKTASMKAAAPTVDTTVDYARLEAETQAAAEEAAAAKKASAAAKRAAAKAEKEAAEKAAAESARLEAERQAETDRLTAEAAKLEAKRVADEAAAAAPAEPERTDLTVKDCRDLAMKALNKQRKDIVQEAFAKVGCPNFPALEKKPEMFATFMEHINAGLNA